MTMDYQDLHGARTDKRLMRSLTVWAALCSLFLFTFPMTSHATEEPDYKVVQRLDDIEVRE